MKAKIPKVQKAVWDAKEKLYDKVKDLSPKEQVLKLLSLGKPYIDQVIN